jgi:thiol:disulfide interchange protein DsbA
MKHLIWISAVLLAFAGCSNEEQAATPSQPSVAQEQPADIDADAMEVTDTAEDSVTEEVLEVVEESAAEAEPEDVAIVLARVDVTDTPRTWKFSEGQHYVRMVPTQSTVGGADKIEVAEVFMYGCTHCYALEPRINAWAETLDPGVRFIRIPAVFNRLAQLHAQLYYTEEVLGRNGVLDNPEAFHAAVFREYHDRANRLTSEASIQKFFERFGVSEEEFSRTWSSFEVNFKLQTAAKLANRYEITAVPTIVVNGKYRVSNSAGAELFEIVDELTVREGLR